MKKVYNLIIAVLIVALIVVVAMIVIRYGGNYLNEKEVSSSLETIEEELNKEETQQSESLPELEFKGYKIEGIIEIPKINIKYPIIDHTNEETMKVSITKFWGPQANEIGNYTVAGHNNKDGTMFGKTKYLQIGDKIKLTNLKNETIEYEIFKIYSIDPDDVSCVESVENGTREITLITCTNGHKNRLVTKARQIL
ncbi:MAG: sortase [Clostridia bacterium]|jgi:LPXTG-site transpeptidase (sortase) family protein|nr:sortase [Clostridia bacterium]